MVIPASEDVLKKDTGEIEHFRSEEESNDVAAIDLNDPEVQLAEKKLRRKIDLRMSILVLVYILVSGRIATNIHRPASDLLPPSELSRQEQHQCRTTEGCSGRVSERFLIGRDVAGPNTHIRAL